MKRKTLILSLILFLFFNFNLTLSNFDTDRTLIEEKSKISDELLGYKSNNTLSDIEWRPIEESITQRKNKDEIKSVDNATSIAEFDIQQRIETITPREDSLTFYL